MRGHMKLFTLRMDLERAQQLKAVKVAGNVGLGSCKDASTSFQRVFSQAPQGLISQR
jgi:hypothetical protein